MKVFNHKELRSHWRKPITIWGALTVSKRAKWMKYERINSFVLWNYVIDNFRPWSACDIVFRLKETTAAQSKLKAYAEL